MRLVCGCVFLHEKKIIKKNNLHSQPQNCFPMLSSKEFRQRERESKTMSTILSIIIREKKKKKERKAQSIAIVFDCVINGKIMRAKRGCEREREKKNLQKFYSRHRSMRGHRNINENDALSHGRAKLYQL